MAKANVDKGELERQIRAGEWLGASAVALVLDMDRKTINTWMKAKPARGPHPAQPPIIRSVRYGERNRRCNPIDVIRILDERRNGAGQPPSM